MEGGRAMGLSSRERRKPVLVLMAARLCRLGGGESEEEMRIADVLHEQGAEKVGFSSSHSGNNDGGSSGGGSRRRERRRGASSPSVRCLSSWWVRSRLSLRCKSLVEEEGDMSREQAVQEKWEVDGASPPLGSTPGTCREAAGGREGEEEVVSSLEAAALRRAGWDRPVRSEDEGWMQPPGDQKPEQTYLSIGMGAGLVFLLARSATEFNKMTELRTEMETLLTEMKGVAQKKNDAGRSSVDPSNNLACCCSSVSCGNMEWSNEISIPEPSHDPSMEMAKGSHAAEIDKTGYYQEDEEAAVGIDQMEEELKSELELLQLNLDKQEHSSEMLSFELPCGTSGVCGYADKNGVVVEQYPEPRERPEEEGAEEAGGRCGGVSPRELMSRLHELVEAQQRERIAELESALQLAHIKLREKEVEACWWRDTARLVSQHKQKTVLLHR